MIHLHSMHVYKSYRYSTLRINYNVHYIPHTDIMVQWIISGLPLETTVQQHWNRHHAFMP